MAKNRKIEATPEEQEIMRKAEAKASAIDTNAAKRAQEIPSFDEEAERKRAMAPKELGLTIVSGADMLDRQNPSKQTQVSYSAKDIANSVALQNLFNDRATDTSNVILSEGTKNAQSIDELNQVGDLANQAKKEEEKEKINAQSNFLYNVGRSQGGSPSYLSETATKEDIGDKVVEDASKQVGYVPSAVVEKLGVQDYYPQIGRDVAVGTFTGSRIGSQTIYSGAGALLPMGLYDARKRALAEAAKNKQASIDKYFDVIDTAPQYQEPFNVSTMDWMNDNLYNKHKGNPDAFLKDPAVRREYARRQGLAKELKHYSTWSDSLLKDAADDKKYVTPDMIEIAGQIKSALVNNTDDVVSGKIDLGPLFAKAQVYQNIIPQIDVMLKQAYSESALGQSPINLRTGEEYDKESFKKDAADFVRKVQSGSIDKDAYITGFKKFFTGKYEQAINGLIESGKYSEEQKQAAMDYFAGQMQEQVKFDTKILGNKAFDRQKLAEETRRWQSEFDQKKASGQGYWNVVNDQMNFKDESSGKSMYQLVADWNKQGLSPSEVKNKMLETARNNGIRNAYISPYTGALTVSMQPSAKEMDKYQNTSIASNDILVKERMWNDKTKKWYYKAKSIPYRDFIDLNNFKTKDGEARYLFENDQKVTKSDVDLYRDASRSNFVSVKANKVEASYGLMNDKTKNIEPLNSSNINNFNANKAVNYKTTVGVAYSRIPIYEQDGTQKVNPETGEKMYKNVALPGTVSFRNEISSDRGRKPLNDIHGDDYKSIFLQEQYMPTSSGSYSYQSGEESSEE